MADECDNLSRHYPSIMVRIVSVVNSDDLDGSDGAETVVFGLVRQPHFGIGVAT